MNTADESIRNQELQIKVLSLVDEYLKDKTNTFNLTPTNLGIQDATLSYLIAEYNRLIIKRENELQVNKSGSPIIRELEHDIEKTRQSVIESIKNIRDAFSLSKQEYQKQKNLVETEMFNLPEKESQIREIKRQQLIKNDLYNYLLQKREETGIQLASIVPGSKIFEVAEANYTPILPKNNNTYMLSLFLGILIPIVIVFIRDLMNDKVTVKGDITKITRMPIIGELGHNHKDKTLVVIKNSRTILAEQFRIIRSNLMAETKKDGPLVILISSSLFNILQ
jgi:uncharacterized protein involved in exopolysaccharide biosynthesis